MKDLIFITAYCPTEEQEKVLEKCVDSALMCGKHVALISHSHVPIHIQKKCHYYVYDYNNEVSDDYNLLGHHSFLFDGQSIQSRFFNKFFYGFAIYRMFCIASQIAINFAYDNIHHIEYDSELLDKELIDENSKLLEEYDSVIYTCNGKEDGFLFGAFKSFKVSSLPEHFKNYNKDVIENEMKLLEPKQLEYFTKNLFIKNGRVFFQSVPSDKRFKKGPNFYNRNLHFTIYYNAVDESMNLFYNSMRDYPEEIVVIVNKTNVVCLQTTPHHWHIRKLGVFNQINHIRIDNSQKVIFEKSFDEEFREIFKVKSYIINA